MALFLLAGIPVYLVLITKLISPGPFNARFALGEAFKGALVFLPAIILYSLIAGLVPPIFDGWGLYLVRTFLDLALVLILALGAYLFLHRRGLILDGQEQFFRALSFLSGYFVLFAVYAFLRFPRWYGAYLYFLLPLLWMGLFSMAALALGAFFSIVGGRRFFFPLGLLGALLFVGFVPFLYLGGYHLLAWVLGLLAFLGWLPLLQRSFLLLK